MKDDLQRQIMTKC